MPSCQNNNQDFKIIVVPNRDGLTSNSTGLRSRSTSSSSSLRPNSPTVADTTIIRKKERRLMRRSISLEEETRPAAANDDTRLVKGTARRRLRRAQSLEDSPTSSSPAPLNNSGSVSSVQKVDRRSFTDSSTTSEILKQAIKRTSSSTRRSTRSKLIVSDSSQDFEYKSGERKPRIRARTRSYSLKDC